MALTGGWRIVPGRLNDETDRAGGTALLHQRRAASEQRSRLDSARPFGSAYDAGRRASAPSQLPFAVARTARIAWTVGTLVVVASLVCGLAEWQRANGRRPFTRNEPTRSHLATDPSEDDLPLVARHRGPGHPDPGLGARRGRCARRGAGRTAGADRVARPRPRHDAGGGRGAGAVARGDRQPAGRILRGDGRRRLPCPAADGDRVAGASGRALDRRSHQPGHRQPAGPAPDGGAVVQRQHPADQRRLHRRPAGDAAQPGPGPHAGAGQRQAPPPLVDHRLARRQRGGVRLAGTRHLGHPRHRAAAGRGTARRRGPRSTGRTRLPAY